MIRYSLLAAVVAFLLVLAWRDWFKSLCGVVLLMAVYGRVDMPQNMFGVQGLNPFNVLLLNVILAWTASRRREGLHWDMPQHVSVLLGLYGAVVLFAFLRMMVDRDGLEIPPVALLSEYLINTFKWVVPGLLLFDGCRTRRRLVMGLAGTLGIYVLLALVVARLVLPTADMAELNRRALKFVDIRTGYHRVDLSAMLAGAFWGIFASRVLLRSWLPRLGVVMAGMVTLYGQAVTAGRAGYLAWAVTGLVLCSLRWRLHLVLASALAFAVVLGVPSVGDRLRVGFLSEEEVEEIPDESESVDEYRLTAGRSEIWPYVIAKISERPFLGYGRLAMRRTGLSHVGEGTFGVFNHPHNAYLELLLDSGLVGFLLVMTFYVVALVTALRLFLDSRSSTFVASGGVALALVIAQLVASMGAQTFYPREGTVGMWCALMLMFRVWVERSRMSSRAGLPGAAAGRPNPEDRLAAASSSCVLVEPERTGGYSR